MMNELSDNIIQDELRPYGFSPNQLQCITIRTYIALLLRWNQRISLTAVIDPIEILRFHFGESIFAASAVPIRGGRLADFGSGAGFPGMALLIAQPALSVALIEPNSKKGAFLAEVSRKLRLAQAVVIRNRMESIPQDLVGFDYITSRALGDYPSLLSVSQWLLATNGKVVLWVGEEESVNLSSQPSWGWSDRIRIPGSKRRFLLVGAPTK